MTSSNPWVEKTSTAYSCSFAQWRCISWSDETSWAHKLSPTFVASVPSSMSKESPSECAGSVLMTTVRYPAAAQRTAVAAATDVLPTPPLPVKRTTLTGRSLRSGCFPPLPGAHHFGDVLLDEGLDMLQDRDRHLGVLLGQRGVLLDRAEDLHVLAIRLVSLVGRVLQSQTVFLRLAVAGQQENRSGVRGLGREGEVEQDVRVGVDVDLARRLECVDRHPTGHQHRLDDQESPRSDECGDAVRQVLAVRRALVMDDVDRVLVVVDLVLAPGQGLVYGDVTGVAGSNGHGSREL